MKNHPLTKSNLDRDFIIQNMELEIKDTDIVITVRHPNKNQYIEVVSWLSDEFEDEIALEAALNAIRLYYTNRETLLTKLGL